MMISRMRRKCPQSRKGLTWLTCLCVGLFVVYITVDGTFYSFDADNGWIAVSDNAGTRIYAYAGSEMTALQPGDSISTLTEQMTMDEISNPEYAAIDYINITITGYVIGTEDVSANPTEAWNQCKLIGNI